jgi:para-nitrobenzyl esterase
MTSRLCAAASAALSLALASAAAAQAASPASPQTPSSPEPAADPLAQLAVMALPSKGETVLTVTSPAFAANGDIPFENTVYRANISPGLAWSAGPKGTRSYALIVQDLDTVYHGGVLVHWTLFDLAPTLTHLEPGMTAPPAGSQYGPNFKGINQPYRGPHTPAGPKHHYHFQVFALDTTIPLRADIDYLGLVAAMKGHVLASGDLVGLSYRDPQAPPPASN